MERAVVGRVGRTLEGTAEVGFRLAVEEMEIPLVVW